MQFTGTNLEIYDDGSNKIVSIGTSNTIDGDLDIGSNVRISGSIRAQSGKIGGWSIGSSFISASASPDTKGISIGSSIFAILVHGEDGKDSFAGTGRNNVKVALGE